MTLFKKCMYVQNKTEIWKVMIQGSSTSQYHNLNLIWVNDIALIYLISKLYWLILHLIFVGCWPNINQATNQFQIVRWTHLYAGAINSTNPTDNRRLLPAMCSLHCAHCALCSISIQCEMLKLFKSSEFFVYFHTGEDFKVHHLFNMSLSIFLFSTSDFLKATNRLKYLVLCLFYPAALSCLSGERFGWAIISFSIFHRHFQLRCICNL